MTAVVIEQATESSTVTEVATSTDKPESAHIVMDRDRDRDDPQAYLMEARIEGIPVTALCGWVWIPIRSAHGLPVCAECLDIYQQDGEHRDERDDLPESQ